MQPARVKHRKTHKGRINGSARLATRGAKVSFGSFGLKAEEAAWLKANQLESARKVMARYIQRGGKIWIRVFPDKPRTDKGGTTGLGGGAGALSHLVAPVEIGRILFEIDGLPEVTAREAPDRKSTRLNSSH